MLIWDKLIHIHVDQIHHTCSDCMDLWCSKCFDLIMKEPVISELYHYFSYDVYEKINTSKSPCNKSNDWSEDNCKLRKVFIIFSIKLILIIYIAFLQQLVDAMVTKFNCVAPWLLKFTRFGILLPFYLEDSWKRFTDKICKHWELLDLYLIFFDFHSYLTSEITWLIRR